MEIGVIGDDDAHCANLLAGVEACTAGRQNAHCYRAGTDEVEAAHDCGLSYGKYRAYQELAALDPTVTPEQVADMTMREIRDRIAALSGTAPLQGTQSPAATSDSAAGDTGAQKEPGHHGAGITAGTTDVPRLFYWGVSNTNWGLSANGRQRRAVPVAVSSVRRTACRQPLL